MTPAGANVPLYDAVIVGSGYGGAVVAARLAAAGRSVCVLERGTTYPPGAFPRTPGAVERAVWMPAEASFGLFDVKELDGVDVLTASGLGGGSLIGSGAMVRPDEAVFAGPTPWPLTRAELEPHLDAAEAALGVNPYPVSQAPYRDTPRLAAVRSASESLDAAHEPLGLAIAFAPDGGQAAPGDPIVEQTPNLHRLRRYTCRLVSECNLGCNYGAKNSLDYTCLSAALISGAELRPGCEALELRRRAGEGYEVRFLDWLTRPVELLPNTRAPRQRPRRATIAGRRVIVAAGALGSTALLLRSAKHLSRLGPRLGKDFGSNGEHVAVAVGCRSSADVEADPDALLDGAHGPVSTSMIRLGNADDRPAVTVHDVGYPDFLAWIAPLLAETEWRGQRHQPQPVRIGASPGADSPQPRPHVRVLRRAYQALTANVPMPRGGWPPGTLALLVHGGPAVRGELSWTGDALRVQWRLPTAGHDGDGTPAREVATALGGRIRGDAASGRLLCLHPLGGCAMGRSSAKGVVDSYGQVFGNPGLYVADGAIVPGPIGEAPALTIAALADRAATAMLEDRSLGRSS